MTDLKAITRNAVLRGGGPVVIAKKLRIAHQAISKWKKVPRHHLQRVSRLTGVSIFQLRPDLYHEGAEINPVSISVTDQLLSYVRAGFAATYAEMIIKREFAPPPNFARTRNKFRFLAIYLACVYVEGVSAPGVGRHFGVSHTTVDKARAYVEDWRDSDVALDGRLENLGAEITELMRKHP